MHMIIPFYIMKNAYSLRNIRRYLSASVFGSFKDELLKILQLDPYVFSTFLYYFRLR
jgi:hypothetical protein